MPSGSSFPPASFRPSFTAFVANTPVRIAPIVPPAPCTPNASRESSYLNLLFTAVTMKKQPTPATKPINNAGNGLTNPEAGVMATRPATAPEIAPKTLGLPLLSHSASIQPRVAAAAPKYVATNALGARLDAARALPAWKPNPPTQN